MNRTYRAESSVHVICLGKRSTTEIIIARHFICIRCKTAYHFYNFILYTKSILRGFILRIYIYKLTLLIQCAPINPWMLAAGLRCRNVSAKCVSECLLQSVQCSAGAVCCCLLNISASGWWHCLGPLVREQNTIVMHSIQNKDRPHW